MFQRIIELRYRCEFRRARSLAQVDPPPRPPGHDSDVGWHDPQALPVTPLGQLLVPGRPSRHSFDRPLAGQCGIESTRATL